MVAVFDKLAVRFQYPENWAIVDEQADEWPHCVSVESPGGDAFWALQIFPSPDDLETLLETSLATFKEEYENLEIDPVNAPIADVETLGYNLCFFYLDLIAQVRIRCFAVGQRAYVVVCQAEDREFDRLERVFEAITVSLLHELAKKELDFDGVENS